MASRKEEKERLRQARLEAEKREASGQRQRLMLGYGIAGVLAIAVVAGVIVVLTSGGGGASGRAHTNQATGSTNGVPVDDRTGNPSPAVKTTNPKLAAKKAGCVLRLELRDEGHDHVPPGTTIKYETDPPTSGDHVQNPDQQADGAYSEMPATIDVVHSLEHGRLAVQYDPSLPERDQLELKGLYDTMYAGSLLFPNPEMPYQVAATAWTNLLGCKSYEGAATLDAIRAFGKATWGRYGGESVDAFGPLTGPNPTDPAQ
ncbi:MAG: DUF3105 domain-containing protein [Solirubrobacterales bacterium]